MAKDHMVDQIPATPPTLEQLKDAIDLRIRQVTEATPQEEMTLENSDLFGDGYMKCIEAMRDAAVMAFDYVASELGVTGFQASVAALQAYGMVMHIDGPFMMLQLRDALYPQSNPVERVEEWLSQESSRTWLQEQVAERMGDTFIPEGIHPTVLAHWHAIQNGHYPKQVD
jgi:hypothetical protein